MTKREIKFRAWVKNLKTYGKVLAIDYHTEEMLVDRNGWLSFDDVIIGQYTGLKDANGVEIYEGDILRTHVVILSPDDQVGVVGCNPNYGYTITYTSGRVARQEYWANDDKANYEVIGNVHENPELLEVK